MLIPNIGYLFHSKRFEERHQEAVEEAFLRFFRPKAKRYGRYCRSFVAHPYILGGWVSAWRNLRRSGCSL